MCQPKPKPTAQGGLGSEPAAATQRGHSRAGGPGGQAGLRVGGGWRTRALLEDLKCPLLLNRGKERARGRAVAACLEAQNMQKARRQIRGN